MKRFLTSVAASTILAAATLAPLTGHAAPAQPRAAMNVSIVSVTPTLVTQKHATVTFHLRVSGLALDAAHMGTADVAGHGHIQLYVDKIPTDAYVRKDLKQHWLAALAATTISLNLSPALVGGAGKHHIIVALAKNSFVLYRVPTATVTLTIK